MALALWGAPRGRAQDAATEERLRQLSGKIENLIEGQEALRRRVEALANELASLREQQNRPAPAYASQENLTRLANAIEQVDRKRIEDNKQIHADLLKLMKAVEAATATSPKKAPGSGSASSSKKNGPPPPDNPPADNPDNAGSQRGFYYPVAQGDTLSAIIIACHEKHIMVTEGQILKANPRLKPDRLTPGMKIFIPLPQENSSQ